jgi:hypothetical protein
MAVMDVCEQTADYGRRITLAIPDDWPNDPDPAGWDALLSTDERLRLPLAGTLQMSAVDRTVTVELKKIEEHEKVSVIVNNWRNPRLESLSIERVERREDRVFVPEGHLAYSGTHEITIALN